MMEKNCKTCKYGHNVRKGVYTANYFCEQLKNNGSNGYFGQLEASCTEWQPKEAVEVEEKMYTIGQMIDMLLGNPERTAKSKNETIAMIREHRLQFYALGKWMDFTPHLSDAAMKWSIIEPKPKRTYKDVLLEKFPKAKVDRILDEYCCAMLFGDVCNEKACGDDCWDREYKEEDGGEG